MAWRDNLIPGSFRGAAFKIESHENASGRRLQIHEYPGRDRPFPEDLGRKARVYDVEAFVVGDDYFRARDALIRACEEPGPGTLIHPYLGTHRVLCDEYRVKETGREGRVARFTLRLIEAGRNEYPSAARDTGENVETAADETNAALVNQFAETYEI